VVVELVSAVRHMAIVVQALSTAVPVGAVQLGAVQLEAVAETTAVQQDNAVRNSAIVAPPHNTVVAVLSPIPAMDYAVAQVVQRDHAVPHMDFVEALLSIAEEPPMATVATVVAALVSAVHNMDIVAPMGPTALSPSSSPESSQLRSRANSKEKRRITMRPWPGRTTALVVQVELVH